MVIGYVIEEGFITISTASTRLRQKTWKKSKRAWRNWLTKITMLSKMTPRDEVIKVFQDRGETYKLRLIEDMPNETKWVYTITKNMLICAVDLTCPIPVSKSRLNSPNEWCLLARWCKNEQLQRIYGTAWADKKT